MAALFFFAGALQYNDPDPVRWIAIYTSAGVLTLLPARRSRVALALAPLVGLVVLAWAAAIVRQGTGINAYLQMLDEWEMRSAQVEAAREVSGLLVVAVWMVVLTVSAFRQSGLRHRR